MEIFDLAYETLITVNYDMTSIIILNTGDTINIDVLTAINFIFNPAYQLIRDKYSSFNKMLIH